MKRFILLLVIILFPLIVSAQEISYLPLQAATSIVKGAWGSGTAALAFVDANTIQVVESELGGVPTLNDPALVTIAGRVYAATAVVTATWADLDTGVEAVGTQYYVYAVPNGTSISLKISTAKTAPVIATAYRLLGSFHNSPTGNIIPGSVSSIARGERDLDGMTKVGNWWVDIYEASVYNSATYGSGTRFETSYSGCATTGVGCTGYYAQSRYGVVPSRNMTQFQALAFCASSGKQLVPDLVWQTAALGTTEVASKTVSSLTSASTTATATITGHGYGGAGATKAVIISGATQTEYNGAVTVTVVDANTVTYTFAGSVTSPATGTIKSQIRTDCIVDAAAPYSAGSATSCASNYGIWDAVGNLWEWTGQWFAGTRANASPAAESPGGSASWSPVLGDYVWNVRGSAYHDGVTGAYKDGLPAAPFRGGGWNGGAYAGVFSVHVDYSPWHAFSSIGARCARQ